MTALRPELLALLEAVKDDPDADAPRLILADWLDDHGDGARAEFIRLQVRLTNQHTADSGSDLRAMHDRVAELENQYRHKWLGTMASPAACSFHRGLVHLRGHPVLFFGDGGGDQERWEACAWIESASLTTLNPQYIIELAESTLSAGLVGLHLELGSPSPGIWSHLAHSPYLNRLRSFGGRLLTEDDLPDLAALECWPRLRTLDLTGNRLSARVVRALAEWPQMTSLQTLRLASNRLGDEGLTALCSCPCLEGLTGLDVALNDVGGRGVAALAWSRHLSGLTTLNLAGNRLTASGIVELARASHFSPKTLGLSRTKLGDNGACVLAKSHVLAKVEDLDLSQNSLTDSVLDALTGIAFPKHLRRLDLAFNRIRDAGVMALAASPYVGRLKVLDIQGNPIRDEGAKAILESPHLTDLAFVSYDEGRLSKKVRALMQSRFGNPSV